LWNTSTGNIKAYLDGVKYLDYTDTTITTPNYFGLKLRDGYDVAVYETQINALESTSTNGVACTLGGVSHGARYDTNEFCGVSFPTATGNYTLWQPALSTNTSYANTGPAATLNLTAMNATGSSLRTASSTTPSRQVAIGSTKPAGQLVFDSEPLTATSTGTGYAIANWSGWSGTEYDWRPTTIFLYPAVTANKTDVPPLATEFSVTRSSGCTPLNTLYQDTSTGTETGWNWTFGDGQISTDQNILVNYSLQGNYTVGMNVSNNRLWYNETVKVNLTNATHTAPFAIIGQGLFTVRIPGRVTFTDESMCGPTSWDWGFADNTTNQTTTDVTHQYKKRGYFPVFLNVSNDLGYSINSSYVRVIGY
jgi:PKD repeat protein